MDQRNESETVGFIDVGTNSIHLLVVRFNPDTTGTPVFHDKESIRLGKSLYGCGIIDSESIDKAALVINRFAQTSRELGADRVVAFATCAAREAANARELIDAVSEHVELRVISGTEEARLISLGVFGSEGPSERTLLLDIGGGSTEVIIRDGSQDIYLDSLAMGAIRYRYNMDIDFSKPVSQSDYGSILRKIDLSSYHSVNKIHCIGFDRALGSSGTMETLAALCSAKRGSKDARYFTFEELHSLMTELCSMTMEQRLSLPGMGKNRADIIIPGGAIAEELMSQFGISRIDISTNGLKQGMMVDHQLSRGNTVFDTRGSTVRGLGHRCRFDSHHAETVERYAMILFEGTRELSLHDLGPGWRSLLSCAALLHDVGEEISFPNHNVLSQAIIENAELPGFTCDETHAMGLIVRFHHKKFPGPKDSRLMDLNRRDSAAIRTCAMLLKIADVMDRHRNDSMIDIGLTRQGDDIILELTSKDDPSMEIWSLEKIAPDFRKLFGVGLVPKAEIVRKSS